MIPKTRLETSIGQDKLAPFNASILDAVNHYVEHLKKLNASLPFSEFAAKLRIELRKDFEGNELDLRNYEKIVLTLKRLGRGFGNRTLCEITTDEVRDWIRGLRLRDEEDSAFLAGAASASTDSPEFDLDQFVIYRCVCGSRAYGLETDDSDTDLRGVYLAPAEMQWSLFGAPDQFEDSARQWVVWELQKFLVMAPQGKSEHPGMPLLPARGESYPARRRASGDA